MKGVLSLTTTADLPLLSGCRRKCLSEQVLFLKSRWRKYFFSCMATEAIERGHHFQFLVLESHVSSVPSKNNRHMAKHLPRKNKTTAFDRVDSIRKPRHRTTPACCLIVPLSRCSCSPFRNSAATKGV